jgi:hypothetical protein
MGLIKVAMISSWEEAIFSNLSELWLMLTSFFFFLPPDDATTMPKAELINNIT